MNHKLGNLNFLEFVHGPESEFKEFELWFKFETRLKYGCFHLKLYSMFEDLSRRSIEIDFLVDLKCG